MQPNGKAKEIAAKDIVPRSGAQWTPEQVFLEHAPRVYSLARRMLGNDADAEDVTQDVLLQVVRKLDTFRGEANLSTWLHRITVNAALAHRRKRANREHREVRDPFNHFTEHGYHAQSIRPWSASPDNIVQSKETTALIEKAITELPEIYRDVYVLADVEGLPNQDIGDMLGLSLPAVKSRLHRGRLLMRHSLAPHFEEATL
ncbi:MAG: sigma-70 family RNA polymerase sigma factor [Planctomycetes bacterium]|nr:sigma-70 family RNA polymerase sigma factor [Planctomycetota bacterium]